MEIHSCLWSEAVEHSAIPEKCLSEDVVVGIDEAGRGPVIGPMVYAAAYWIKSKNEEMQKKGFNDSKQLTADKREDLLSAIEDAQDIGYVVRVLSPKEICGNMLQAQPYNLNEMSHGAAISMIKELLRLKVNVKEVYIDTVGDPQKYENKLRAIFNFTTIKFLVSKKADALYKCVSAASIVAKTRRDHMIVNNVYEEPYMRDHSFGEMGSGYPSDPITKTYLSNAIEPLFGFPTFIRFSWSTIPKLIQEKNGVVVKWVEGFEEGELEKREKTKKKGGKFPSLYLESHHISQCKLYSLCYHKTDY